MGLDSLSLGYQYFIQCEAGRAYVQSSNHTARLVPDNVNVLESKHRISHLPYASLTSTDKASGLTSSADSI
jgi:hypothetical protein